jgi:predicted RecA/RadA family phage recombinase
MNMAEAVSYQQGDIISFTTVAAVSAGEVLQVPDGRVGVAIAARDAGELASCEITGIKKLAKTANEIYVPGQRLYWDASASAVTAVPPITAADFFVGCATNDAAAADTVAEVAINTDWEGSIDQRTATFAVLPVLTAGDPRGYQIGGGLRFTIDATNEAQKIDALSHKAVALDSDWIFMAEVVIDAAAGSATDISIGVADGTHATDFQSVATLCTIHVDGGSQNILVQSDDGTTDVAPIDSTIDWTAAVPFALAIDGRNPADIKLYINGIRETASSTTLALAAAASGLKACVHIEKTASTDVATVTVSNMKVMTGDL